jgi:hypothetical protein
MAATAASRPSIVLRLHLAYQLNRPKNPNPGLLGLRRTRVTGAREANARGGVDEVAVSVSVILVFVRTKTP